LDLLLILTYTAICIVVFKVFKIPLNKWSVPSAVLGGIALLGTLILLMNYNHPYSESARKYYVTTPVIPSVTGRVIDVPVQGNQRLAKGDTLFKLDPTPFQAKVEGLTARLVSAQADLQRAEELVKRGAGSTRDRDLAQAQVDDISAQLSVAEFNLEQTTVVAPTAGYATQVVLQPGMVAASLPLRPVMVFVHEQDDLFVAWFRQNSLLRLTKGDEAEIAFDGIPGKVFSGEVASLFPALAAGQIQPTGDVLAEHPTAFAGRVPVSIRITDPQFEAFRAALPGGAYGQAALYSEHFHHVAIMRKIILRMSSWMNYFFPFH